MRILEAAVLYYAVVFGAGFLLGQLEQTIFRAAHRGTLQPALRTSCHRAHPGTGRPDSGGDTACTDRWTGARASLELIWTSATGWWQGYGPDGQIQKTPIWAEPEQPSGGRLKGQSSCDEW
jgi:hypothetical protein